jgi:hypothetical protein
VHQTGKGLLAEQTRMRLHEKTTFHN